MPYPSYTQFQRFLATLLLFSFLLESCHNPNIGMGRRSISPPQEASGGNTSPEEEPYDNYYEQPPTTTADNHPTESRQTAPDTEQAQEQPGQQGDQAQRQEREPAIVKEAAIVEVSEEPAQPSTAVIPPLTLVTQPPSQADNAPQHTASQLFLAQGGQQGKGISAGGLSGRDQHQGEPTTREQGDASGSDQQQALEPPQGRGAYLVTLQERIAQGDPTAKIIKEFNDGQTEDRQKELQKRIERYIDWFHEQRVGKLALIPEKIQEYTCLAHIKPTPEKNRRLLKSYFDSLYDKIDAQYERLIQALEYTLQTIDSRVFEGQTGQLIQLGHKLLNKLDPTRNDFKKNNYPIHRSALLTLYYTFILIQEIEGKWDPTKEKGPYREFKAKIDELKGNAQYYPIRYHALFLEQSLQRLESCKDRSEDLPRRLRHGFKATSYLYEGAPIPPYFKPNLDKLINGWEHLKATFGPRGIQPKSWYDWLLDLSHATLLTLQDPNQYEDFNKRLQKLKDKKWVRNENRTALCFGAVMQLGKLALDGPTDVVRKASIDWLSSVAKVEAWGGYEEVMEPILESLATVVVEGQAKDDRDEEVTQAREALEELANGLPKTNKFLEKLGNSFNRPKRAAQKAINKWLDEQRMNQKLSAMTARAATPVLGGLFSEIESLFRQEMPVETLSPAATQEVRKALREHYQQPEFAQVKSLFEGEPPKHVDSLECQLMLIELVQKQADPQGPKDEISTHRERLGWVKNPIALKDMFKPRSTKPGEAECEIQKVLLVGDPGTGKTTLSRKLAYRWAKGRWGKELNAVYVLPVRALQAGKYDDKGSFRNEATLATAIVNNCFSPCEEEEYKRLRQQINEELKQSTTLVVLDGLDEGGAGTSEAVLKQAKAGRHKLLMLSRPYGIEQERTMADIEIEHTGFNDEQMEAYVRGDLSAELGEELLEFIKEYPAIASIAHVPVNLQILCALWKDNRASVRKAVRNGGLPGLYCRLTEYTWERYVKERNVQDADTYCEEVFDTLGKIALDALQQGQQLISPELVREHVDVSRVSKLLPDMQAAGFLLLQAVGSQYQFPHLTFQEYFAGRTLARQLFASEDKVRAKAEKFFTNHKYEPQYSRMLSFLAGEVSKLEELGGTRQLLKLANTGPQEVVGVQHLLLQLRLLNEWLCLAGEDQEDALAFLEGDFRVMESLKEWFVEGLDQVRRGGNRPWYDRERDDNKLLDLLTTTLQGFRVVTAYAPALPEPLLDACKDSVYYVRDAASKALGAVGKADPEKVIPLIQKAIGDESRYVRRDAIEALVELGKDEPEQVIPLLQKAIEDESKDVREAAIEALREVGQSAPAQVIPMIQVGIKDPYSLVCSAASWALGEVCKADPEQTIPLIQVGIGDKDFYVRRDAIEALGAVWKADPEKVTPLLQKAIGDESEDVRYAAIKALRAVGKADPEKVIPLLQKAIGDESQYVRRDAIEALGELGKDEPEQIIPLLQKAIEDESEDVREAAIEALGEVAKARPTQAFLLLQVGIRDKSKYVRSAAIRALREVGKASPEQVIPLLQEAMGDEDFLVRHNAIKALGEVAKAYPTQAIPLLRAAMEDEDKYVRRDAIEALVELGKDEPEQVIPLLQKAIEDESEDVREAAIEALGEVAKARPTQAFLLLQVGIGDKDFYVRRDAIEALRAVGKADPEKVIPLLQKAMGDESEDVRRVAIEALGEVVEADPKKVIPLIQKAIGDESKKVRKAAIEALGEVGKASPEQVIPWIRAAMGDESEYVRHAARNALSQFSLEQLMNGYWATQHQALIPLIASQLYYTPLLVRDSLKPHHQKLVLYPTVEEPVKWEKPQEEVQHFIQLIKSAAKQNRTNRHMLTVRSN